MTKEKEEEIKTYITLDNEDVRNLLKNREIIKGNNKIVLWGKIDLEYDHGIFYDKSANE